MYHQPKLYFITPIILIILSLFSRATMYENAEDNSTNRWSAYDKETLYDRNASDQIIKNKFDKTKKSHVIKFEGKDIQHIYLIGAIKGADTWGNTKESLLTWSMKMQKFYQIIVFIETEQGPKYLYFAYDSKGKKINSNQYIYTNLAGSHKEEQWQNFSFDIATIVEKDTPNNKLLSINGLTVQGKGSIDDIQLTSNTQAFITTWKIDDRKKLRISTNNTFDYNFHINWGDGSVDNNITDSITHVYAQEGEYTISITGKYPHIHKPCERKQNLIKLNQWGTQQWKSMKEAFKECENFTHISDIKAPNFSQVKSMYRMFYNAQQFDQNISHWDVSHITDMNSMFYNAYQFNQDIGQWDVSHVEDMQVMFKSAKAFNQDISDWNVSSVKKMRKIFYEAENFNKDISKWDISSVIDQNPITKSGQEENIHKQPSVITDIQYELELINGVNETP